MLQSYAVTRKNMMAIYEKNKKMFLMRIYKEIVCNSVTL